MSIETELADSIMAEVVNAIRDSLGSVRIRLDALDEQVSELRARPKGLTYRGVWVDGESYQKGDCVTRASSMWTCLRDDATSIPGTDAGAHDWQLSAKGARR